MNLKRAYLGVLAALAGAAGLLGYAGAQSAGQLPTEWTATVVSESQKQDATDERRKSASELRAEALLAKAAQHIETHGRKGTADFSSEPDFIDRDLYVFALDTNGVMLGSGGWSVSLVGQNVLDELDAKGQPFFRQMLAQAGAHGGGKIQYEWYNPANAHSTRKTTNFVQVDDVVVGVGFYIERATPTDAKRLLGRAVEALQRDVPSALMAFQDPGGPYVPNDLYVFVVDTRDQRFLAHGGTAGLVGTDAFGLQDTSGRHIVREMVEAARSSGDGSLDYPWRNPLTGQIENKRSFFTLRDGLLVGVGSYQPS